MENFLLENVFVTEGVPEVTFVQPPNYKEILVDIRREGKPVIIEGQSGTGKTTAVKKILAEVFPGTSPQVLTPREPGHAEIINNISDKSGNKVYVIDDFHRLNNKVKERIADLAKVVAERDERDNLPKLIIVGINNVGSDLIQLVPDIAKRIGIHRIQPGTESEINRIISEGSSKLNIKIGTPERIFEECRGDYWLTQQLCKMICTSQKVDKTVSEEKELIWDFATVVKQVVSSLEHNYDPPVRTFCRGRRFRPTNDPYYKLLRAVSKERSSSVDLNELANANPEVKGSITNVKDHRLSILIDEKPECSRLFYYDKQTKNFALEDPALFFYLRNLDWNELRDRCGFREAEIDYEFDVALSFAGENRELAEFISDQLKELDISVFYDRNYEDNLLGGPWSSYFKEIFGKTSRLVVVLLDAHHNEKVWPTFERDCFLPRVKSGEVIPVFLDDTLFVGIPTDIVAIQYKNNGKVAENKDKIIDDVVLRIAAKLDNM